MGGGIPYKGSNPITPGKSNITIAAHTLLKEALTINGDADLIASNIRKGKNLFGVLGTMEEGVTGIDCGEVTLTAATKRIQVSHKLGKVPTRFALLPVAITKTSYTICALYYTTERFGSLYAYGIVSQIAYNTDYLAAKELVSSNIMSEEFVPTNADIVIDIASGTQICKGSYVWFAW